ncbi:MAG TPA: GntR family transcriptional regulator [Candidatus Gemmiger stercoravium]|uniref:GntR family transcriptional regulator n=1 Tax=uncultured Subdoligranulum sp. TaxID=512298 RepID=UPI001F9ECFB2|nr:GntR family transcriptional regulator [uncultured Subdoligranulum sp.]HJC55156.1 GntR family transcriptional regulator [Candidatus Gemmiger stercoravium]
MDWNISAGRPVYLQLIEQLQAAIVAGALPAGARVPPVRELAAEAGVNPNTMQRALQDLEGRGLIQTQRTAGRTVTTDTRLLEELRSGQARALAKTFWRQMQTLGLDAEQVQALLQQIVQEEDSQ